MRWDLLPRPNTAHRGSTPTSSTKCSPTPDAIPICLRHKPPRPFPRSSPRGPGPRDACVTAPSSRAPAPSGPRHVTRHAPAARGLHQNKNRRGRAAAGARGAGGERGQWGAGAPPPPLPSAAAAPRPPRAARPGRLGPGGQRAPPCLQPSLLAGDPARKRSPRRRPWSAHPPAAETLAARNKTVATALGSRPCESPLLLGPPPTRLRISPVTTLATHFTLSQLQRFCRPPSRGRLLPAAALPRDKGCGPSRT